ncbi:NAD-specific glutamate dehydrogenase [compost metagenome]
MTLAGSFICCRHVYDPVRIDVEGNFDLRYAAWCEWNVTQHEASQRFVASCHLPFPLQDVDFYAWLVIGISGEYLRFACRNRCVPFNHLRKYAAGRFDPERKRSNVEQYNVFHIARQHAGLHRCSKCNNFVRVHAFVRFFTGQFLNCFLNGWNPRGTADKNDPIDIRRRHPRIA